MAARPRVSGRRSRSGEQIPENAGTPHRPFESCGLSLEEVELSRKRHGLNSLPSPTRLPISRRLLSQLFQFFAVILWIAGALAILAGMPQLGYAIFIVIIFNGLFGFIQGYRAEKAGERLRDLLPRRATVIREGRRESISATGLVPKDIVVISAGDRISADIRLVKVYALSVDAASLTGESVPATPQPGEIIFAGTFAVAGEAVGIVTATGNSTRLAEIARMAAAGRRPQSPLALELNRVVRVIAWTCIAAGSVFLAIALLVGIRLSDAFLFALGVTVALVPEGLLPTVTLSLAMGAKKMAARGALVRRLESVETLGSATFICTDKTGTLTRNEMCVVEAWTPMGTLSIEGMGYDPTGTVHLEPELAPLIRELALAAALHSKGRAVMQKGRWFAQGNPLEAALTVFSRRLNIDLSTEEGRLTETRRFPFDPQRRRMSIVVGNRVFVRGAPEAVLECCRQAQGVEQALSKMTEEGLRVIAVAARDLDGLSADTVDAAESDLTLLGLLGIEDPPRPGVADSIAACRRAGIRVAMVTGDHRGTACAIAREVGLWSSDDHVIEGKDLPEDEEVLGALLDRDGMVVSRVSPEEKLRIARALRKRGHVVAMTGDGVNDAPALHEADIGVAMGLTGTDVAREAADLVLLDDNFTTIVAAIEQGRTTFANARRFLTYHLTDNIAELTPFLVWAFSGGRFPLALGVLQVLCLDIGTDILPAVALGAEPSSPRALAQHPSGRHLVDRFVLFRAFAVLGVTESVIEMLAFLAALSSSGWKPGHHFPTGAAFLAASGAAFSAVVIGQMANAFACRSATVWPGRLGWFSNRYLICAILCEAVMLIGFLYAPPIARILGQAPPSNIGYVAALLAIPAVLTADLLYKRCKARK